MTSTVRTARVRTARFAGLDGLRALAVTLVVIYHLFPASPLRGGFVGVDAFFVISGFLITSLLLRDAHLARSRRMHRLLDFWRRRARRLLPALAVVVTVTATAAWVIGGDVLVDIGRQVLGAATFSYNWLAVADGGDYFAATSPELLRNVWSLAVEEQFYVLWPLLLPLVLLIPWRAVHVALALVAAAGSAWWMWMLVDGGAVTRAYFGTDTHAFGLFLGIALAFAIERMPDRAWMHTATAKVSGVVVGAAGVALIVLASLRPESPDATTFPGTLLAASFGTVLAILASVVPGSVFGPAIDVAPLRWIGDRSYGIYLWHWPLLVLVTVALTGVGPEGGVPMPAALLALALTVGCAALSYTLVEQPLRRGGFRRSVRALGIRLAGTPSMRFAALSALVIAGCAIGGTTAAVAQAPEQTSAEANIMAGMQAMQNADAADGGTHTGGAVQGSIEGTTEETEDTEPREVTGSEITAVGDSVMLASAESLLETLPGISVDAEVSRSIWAGPEILQALADAGELRDYVVVALGTNGPITREALRDMATIAGPERDLILVNAHAPRDWIPGVNAELSAYADRYPRVWLADWAEAIAPHRDLLAADDIHPGRRGGDVFAQIVASTIEHIEIERVRALDAVDKAPGGFAPRVPFPEQPLP